MLVNYNGRIYECYIEAEYKNNTARICIPCFDYRGFRSGELCATVNKCDLIDERSAPDIERDIMP